MYILKIGRALRILKWDQSQNLETPLQCNMRGSAVVIEDTSTSTFWVKMIPPAPQKVMQRLLTDGIHPISWDCQCMGKKDWMSWRQWYDDASQTSRTKM